MNMSRKLPSEQLVIQYRHVPEKGYTELTVCAYDAYGMFYRTAGTIAAKNLNILKAKSIYVEKRSDDRYLSDHRFARQSLFL